MRDRLLGLLIALLLVTAPANAKKAEKKTYKDHVVFLIHGLMGNKKSFCDLQEIIENRNLGEKSGTRVHVVPLEYDTHSQVLGTWDFAQDIGREIDRFLSKDKRINTPETAYSIIAHSQGGLVTMKYIDRCLVSKSCTAEARKPLKILAELKQVITLGTPFWGSSNANNISNPENITNQLNGLFQGWSNRATSRTDREKQAVSEREMQTALLKLKAEERKREREQTARKERLSALESAQQIEDLQISSPEIYQTRAALIAAFKNNGRQNKLKNLLNQIEFHSIGGEIRQNIAISKMGMIARNLVTYALGAKEESDLVVGTTLARPQFIHYNPSTMKSTVIEFGKNKSRDNTVRYFPIPHTQYGGRPGLSCVKKESLGPNGLEEAELDRALGRHLLSILTSNFAAKESRRVFVNKNPLVKLTNYSFEIRIDLSSILSAEDAKKITEGVKVTVDKNTELIKSGGLSDLEHARLDENAFSGRTLVISRTGKFLSKKASENITVDIDLGEGFGKHVLKNFKVMRGMNTFAEIGGVPRSR